MTPRDTRGQALVEMAVGLPIILVMFAGLYIACRTAFLASGAQSATQAEALRAGRCQPGIEKQLAASLLPGETGVSVRSTSSGEARLLPSPFPALTGRSSGIVSLTKSWSEVGSIGEFPPLALVRRSDLSVDCWGKNSSSGKGIARVIQARIALGAIR